MAANLLDEGDVATLLAFVDEFDATPLSFPSTPSSPELVSSPPSSGASSASDRSPAAADSFGSSSEPDVASGDDLPDTPPADATADIDSGVPAPQKKKKKKRSPASSSTVLQRRKRAEIAALRELAVELEAQVADLKRLRPSSKLRAVAGPMRKPGAPRSVWQELAALQSHERHRAEMTNRKLKTILSDQQQINDALRTLLSKRSVLQGLEAMADTEPVYRSPVILDCAPDTLGMLEKQVEALYIGMDRHKPPALPPSVSSTTEILSSKMRGHTIQVVTTTPMSCPMEEAAEILWQQMNIKREYADKSYNFFCRPDDQALEKNFVMVIRDSSSNFQINGLQFMRKFTEKERIVIVRTNLMLLPTSGLRFRDRVWTTVSRVGSGVGEASVVETRYQLNAETEEGLAASPDDLSYVQQYLMQRLSSNSRMYEQFLQSTLLAEDTRRRAVREVF